MDGSSDASPVHSTEQDTGADEASGGRLLKFRKHLHQVQKAKKKKNKKHRKRMKGQSPLVGTLCAAPVHKVEERAERLICDLRRQNAEMLKETDNLKSKAAEMNYKQMITEFSNVKKRIANQESLVETFLQEPLVQQLVLGANNVEDPLLGNRLGGTGELKDRAMMLELQIDWLCRLFV